MASVPSSLIARNESWVRQQANALVRRLPSNVEKADLIQAGLIAVAQSALSFEWEGDQESEEGKQAFVRYARMRVKGAMIDELRQMDALARPQRRKVTAIQIARERWRATHDAAPTLAELSGVCGISVEEIAALEHAARMAYVQRGGDATASTEDRPAMEPATQADEVEARVDTAIVMRRLAKFFESLPLRDRQLIDAYFGISMTPTELASSLDVSASRLSQMYKGLVQRVAHHFSKPDQRAVDRLGGSVTAHFSDLIASREAELARLPSAGPWGEIVEVALTKPIERGWLVP